MDTTVSLQNEFSWNVPLAHFKKISYFVGFPVFFAAFLLFGSTYLNYAGEIPSFEQPHQYQHSYLPDNEYFLDMRPERYGVRPYQASIIAPPKPKLPTFMYDGAQYNILPSGQLQDSKGRIWKKMTVTTTAYTATVEECDNDPTHTATMTKAKKTYGIAVDPKIIPYGTLIHVSGYGIHPADDTGRAMRSATRRGEIQLDLRIPQRRSDGIWRSDKEVKKIARNHGIQEDHLVLVQVK